MLIELQGHFIIFTLFIMMESYSNLEVVVEGFLLGAKLLSEFLLFGNLLPSSSINEHDDILNDLICHLFEWS